jgi:hypothetical protein
MLIYVPIAKPYMLLEEKHLERKMYASYFMLMMVCDHLCGLVVRVSGC